MVHALPKGIGPKVNAMVRLAFEFEGAVQHFSHYSKRDSSQKDKKFTEREKERERERRWCA